MGGPASSYATAGIALRVVGVLKPPHHDKVETPRGGKFTMNFTNCDITQTHYICIILYIYICIVYWVLNIMCLMPEDGR
jgi:hypothetical protein